MKTIMFIPIITNIQLFGTQTTLLNTPGNDLSPEMKTFYDMTLIDMASPQLVHEQFGQKRPIPANNGKTIEFRKFSSLPKATTPLTESVTPAGNVLDVTTITAHVAQYGDYITQSDVLELTAIDNTIVEATKILGKQAGLTLDTVVRNALHTGSNISYASAWNNGVEVPVNERAKIDTSATLKVDTIERAVAKMRANNVPTINGDYVCIIHPYVAYDLRRDPDWLDAHKYASPEELYNGEIGKIAGVRFVASSEAKIYRGDDLASNSRTLRINNSGGYSGAITAVAFDGGTVVANSLIGRYININGVRAKITANTTTSLTFASTNFGTVADNAVIYPGEGGKEGISVYGNIMLGDGAYGVTEVTGGGLETIVKQKGSGGTSDPLNQRSSVGWKALKTAEILVPEYLLRIECTSKYNNIAAN